jgi:hypothetical protein
MDINQARLKLNIVRIRKTFREMQALVDTDLDCSGAALVPCAPSERPEAMWTIPKGGGSPSSYR